MWQFCLFLDTCNTCFKSWHDVPRPSKKCLRRARTVMKGLICACKGQAEWQCAVAGLSQEPCSWQLRGHALCRGFCQPSQLRELALMPGTPNPNTHWHCPLRLPSHSLLHLFCKNWAVLEVWDCWSCQNQKHKQSWGLSCTAPESADSLLFDASFNFLNFN